MVRLSFLCSIAAVALLLPSTAFACEGHGDARAEVSTTAEQKSTTASQPEPAPATGLGSAQLLHEVDELVAAKCSCKNAADCTCKKGQCKCKGCKPRRLVEPMKGTSDALRLPKEARHDASSGVFI